MIIFCFLKPFTSEYFWVILAQSLNNLNLFVGNEVLNFKHGVQQGFTEVRFLVFVEKLVSEFWNYFLFVENLINGRANLISYKLVSIRNPV